MEKLNMTRIAELDNLLKQINNGADINTQDHLGDTALIKAAIYGKRNIVKTLLENSAKVDLTDQNGYTALMEVSLLGEFDIAKLLVEYGANVNLKNKDEGNTALNIACNSSRNTALTLASLTGKSSIVKLLVENGADINTQNEKGETPLMIATSSDRPEIVKFLLNNGAKIDIKNNKNETVLELASKYSSTDTIAREKILKMIELKQNKNETLVELIDNIPINGEKIKERDLARIEFLFSNDKSGIIPDINIKGKDGWTLAQLASVSGDVNAMRFLIGKGANLLLATNSNGRDTPVKLAENIKDPVLKKEMFSLINEIIGEKRYSKIQENTKENISINDMSDSFNKMMSNESIETVGGTFKKEYRSLDEMADDFVNQLSDEKGNEGNENIDKEEQIKIISGNNLSMSEIKDVTNNPTSDIKTIKGAIEKAFDLKMPIDFKDSKGNGLIENIVLSNKSNDTKKEIIDYLVTKGIKIDLKKDASLKKCLIEKHMLGYVNSVLGKKEETKEMSRIGKSLLSLGINEGIIPTFSKFLSKMELLKTSEGLVSFSNAPKESLIDLLSSIKDMKNIVSAELMEKVASDDQVSKTEANQIKQSINESFYFEFEPNDLNNKTEK